MKKLFILIFSILLFPNAAWTKSNNSIDIGCDFNVTTINILGEKDTTTIQNMLPYNYYLAINFGISEDNILTGKLSIAPNKLSAEKTLQLEDFFYSINFHHNF